MEADLKSVCATCACMLAELTYLGEFPNFFNMFGLIL